jgi:hypothetical protein
LPLSNLRAAVRALTTYREKISASTAECLAAAAEVTGTLEPEGLAALAKKHGLDPVVLAARLDCLGIGAGEAPIDSFLTQKMEGATITACGRSHAGRAFRRAHGGMISRIEFHK